MASIAELILAKGQQSANARRRSGEISARMYSDLGNIAAGAVQSYAQEKAEAPRRAQQARLGELQLAGAEADAAARDNEAQASAALRDLFARPEGPDPNEIIAVVGPERGTKIVHGLAALQDVKLQRFKTQQEVVAATLAGMDALPEEVRAEVYPTVRQNLLSRQIIAPEDAPEAYDAGWFQQARGFGQAAPKAPGTREIKVRNADGSESIQIVTDTPGQTFESAAPIKEEKTYAVTVRGPGGRPVKKVFTESQLQQGVEEYREPSGGGSRFWVMRDGQPMRISEAEYRQGDRPASNREQGRPVTSGDAGRIAELTTSLDDVKVLRDTVIPRDKDGNVTEFGTTGTRAAIGAAVPNVVTEMFGWGEDAKKRQATIDRVKQVIGKALEGGVLRKEDEYKYTKILPTISDVASVVESKLKDLDAAIKLRRERQIDALEDAGYDVSAFRARDAAGGPTGSLKVGGFTVEVEKPKGGG